MKNTNSKEIVIQIDNLQKHFGSLEVLKDISLKLYKGENLVVLGKSGTGKSVLIKCIVRLLDADAGTIDIDGVEINSLKEKELNVAREKIGFLFQSGALYDSMTVRENLAFPLKRIKKDLSSEQINAKIVEALENVSLPNVIDKMPSELSGGMRKRVSLARTIIVDPSIMLYDEPTTGLHFEDIRVLMDVINKLVDKGNTILIIEHNMDVIKLADYIIDIGPEGGKGGGQVIAVGTPEEVAKNKKSYTAPFLKKELL